MLLLFSRATERSEICEHSSGEVKHKKNPSVVSEGIIYRWVSKYGNQIPFTILEINSFNQKIFSNYFINIFGIAVDKPSGNTINLIDD